ncbi:MAG: PIN domain-containing protein [Deltaproteobacteria bacterium]|nr:PIN domain-containing protein [Deltaproteobacteria bacterium]
MILIDTSAWIDFFHGKYNWISEHINHELLSGMPALCGPIWLELVRGLHHKKDTKKILELFKSCHWLKEPDDFWNEAGELGKYLAQKGYTIGSIDLLIAVHAIAHQIPLLTTDEDFKYMVKVGIPLQLVYPL